MSRTLGMYVVGLVVVLGGGAGCARPQDQPGVVLPTSRTVVAEWISEGGFVPAGWQLVRAPRLTVYSDGTAVADADRTLVLTSDEVTGLVAELRADLAGLGPTVEPTGGMQVADAPDTVLTVLAADGTTRAVRANALGIQSGYPDRLVNAGEAMRVLQERVGRDGAPFTSDRVRVVAIPGEGDAPPWPRDVPPPPWPPRDDFPASAYDLGGADAVAVRENLPGGFLAGGAWPTRRLPDGAVVAVAWRYLLAHE